MHAFIHSFIYNLFVFLFTFKVPTPIDTKGFQTVLNLVENTCKDSFDLFFGLYYYNSFAASQLQNIREALAQVERQLAAKEGETRYLSLQRFTVVIISLPRCQG